MGEKRINTYRVLLGRSVGKRHLDDLIIDGKIL
jgi:hypothetical protein